MFPLPFFSFFQVTMSQDRIVMCFHEYVMKKKKKVRSIMVTNPNYGKHTPNKCYRKHISVLNEVIEEGKQKEERRKLHHHQRSSEMRV